MNRNYQKELDRIIQKRGQKVPRVLLHACCGVCSGAVLEYLTQYFDVTVLWYNPNLYPQAEFDRRFQALVEMIEKMGLADRVSILAESWKHEDYDRRVKGLEQEPEGGARCTECFRLRLLETARLAKHYGYDYFCTTLTLSRHKDEKRGCPRTSKSRGGRCAPGTWQTSTASISSSTAAASFLSTKKREAKTVKRDKRRVKPAPDAALFHNLSCFCQACRPLRFPKSKPSEAGLIGRGKRKERICSFCGSFGKRKSGMARVSFDEKAGFHTQL